MSESEVDATSTVQGQSWNLSSEYPAADSAAVEDDLSVLAGLIADIETHNLALTPPLGRAAELSVESGADAVSVARTIHGVIERAATIAGDLSGYASCCLSVDSQDAAAQDLQGRLLAVQSRLKNAAEPLDQFLTLVPDAVVEAYLDDDTTAASRFAVEHQRKRRHELLPLEQETLVNSLAQDGINAWSLLYDQLSGSLTCEVALGDETRTLGIAEAAGLMLGPDEHLRETAWRAINATWDEHVESCAAAVNAIAGWRLSMCRRRGNGVHYLDAPAHANRMRRETIDTLISVAEEGVPLARRAAQLQAKAYGKARYGPWDQRAPAPALPDIDAARIPYDEAVDLIAESYSSVAPEMGDFCRMMAKKHWIEGTVGPRKRPGAYCTGFRKSRTPRVYMTYTGGASDVITLAHELGHAYHAWVMRDLPDSQRSYGMSIAETASTFGETIVRDALRDRADGPQAELPIAWEEASAVVTFILNIPTRFEFERNFHEARAEKPLRPDELKAMMSAAWKKWYGEALSEPDPLFWANKLHFYISGLSFYNFPYLFGYLFSQGLYARRSQLGDGFFDRYQALLRDTGRMTTEDLAAKHLDVDLTRPDFWLETLESLAPRVDDFERLVESTTS